MTDVTPSEIRSALDEWYDPEHEYEPGFDELISEETQNIKTDIGTFNVESYEIIGGYEQEAQVVITHVETGKTYAWDGYYTSYDGAQFDNDGYEVVPAEVTKKVWVKA